jgi:ribosomal protein L37AE/L43A
MTLRARIGRAYHLLCAREDVRRRGLVVPAGVWLCEHCHQVSLDVVRLRQHVAGAHA